MRLAIGQVNPLVGDLAGNARRILDAARRAAQSSADLLAIPELALVGYPPLDLLDDPSFVAAALAERGRLVEALGRAAPGLTVVLGALGRAPEEPGKGLLNEAVACRGGKEIAARAKTLLPTYDVFDEERWFVPARDNAVVVLAGRRVGLTVCEDIWNDALYWSRRLYAADPVASLVGQGAEIILNISASPYHRGKPALREAMLAATARRHGVTVVLANQVGGNDDLVFDGGSLVVDPRGQVTHRATPFAEDLLIADLDEAPGPATSPPQGDAREVRQALVLGLHDYVEKCGFPGVLLGLSGGIDSAVVAALAVEALGPDRVEGVLMPSRYSSEGSVRDSLDLASRLGIRTRTIPLESLHAAFLTALADTLPAAPRGGPDVTEQNLQARIRGTLLMALSNRLGRLVLSTGNKSELAVGYCTLYGDMNGGLAVIGDCLKGWVREIAESCNSASELIPRAILQKPPSAELAPDQRDEDDLPPYPVLDAVLEGLIERRASVDELVAEGLPREVVERVRRLVARNEYKRRQAPPVLRVTAKAFGAGRRIPLARATT